MISMPFDGSTEITDFRIENGMIHWTTSKEIDNKEFIIEASVDGEHWTAVDHLEGKQYSDINREYRYQLKTPSVTTYFRLQREDMEGKTQTYEKVLVYEVLGETPYLNYEVEGNNINFKTNDGNIYVMILDAAGHEEYQGHTKDGGQLSLERGVYFIKLTSAHQHLFKQVIIK
ncbi:T9SS type A sorting domain-containing protein [Flammeovirga aprica JL-4]|uniref:T9SS type A sorting domain-containing protein n=2 Tax=Flammeovirga aprica TaxID=29528 RepID=A0A7X9RZL1_9BACT|nr:T9SS type A sorting domain-containing protein [Flammeovirga aprica JL-4]